MPSRAISTRRAGLWLLAPVLVTALTGCGGSTSTNPAPVASDATSSSGVVAGPERETMKRLAAAVAQWNEAAKPVVADMDDATLDVAGFGDRTARDRAKMRTSIQAMEAAIAPGANAAFSAAVREIIGAFRDKIDVIDRFVVAVADSDSSGMDAAATGWDAAAKRYDRAVSGYLEAARPYLSPDETSAWEQLVRGS